MLLKHWTARLSERLRSAGARRRKRPRVVPVPQCVEILEDRQLLSAITGVPAAVAGQNPEFVPGQLLIQFNPDAGETARDQVRQQLGATLIERIETEAMKAAGTGVLELVNLPPGLAVAQAAGGLKGHPLVRFAEPNWVLTHQAVSNDPYYTSGQLWGMNGDDESVSPSVSTNPYGSQSEEAWHGGNVGSRTVYVGIIDEGIDYRHPDLYLNIGINQAEIPSNVRANLTDVDADGLITFYDLNHKDSSGVAVNQGAGKITDLNKTGYIDGGDLLYAASNGGWMDGTDADGNGLKDDLVGWDFAGGNNTTYDGTSDDHGTHVAGTIGALGGNGVGVAGVNWEISMIPVKFLGTFGGTTANAIQAVDYITNLKRSQGLNIVATNNSWGGGGFSQGLLDAIGRAAQADILFIAAAGNGGSDGIGDNNDTTANYPSNYDTTAIAGYDSVVAVAATGIGGGLENFSNYGATTVDLGAPGSGIWSTLPEGKYQPYSGTSMATPHVTGAAALYAAANPGASAQAIKQAIFGSVIKSDSLAGKTATGGRLNVGGFVASSHDVAVTAVAAPAAVVVGTEVAVDVSVKNEGTYGETFTLTLSASGGIVEVPSRSVTLAAGASATVQFVWDTSGLSTKDYTLTATADPVDSETDLADNSRTTAVSVAPETHDVAVTSILAPAEIAAGGTATVEVTIANQGNVSETFTVHLAASGGVVQTGSQSVTLEAGASTTLRFLWDTTGLSAGDYTLTATADPVGTDSSPETNTADNTRNATVVVTTGSENDMYVRDILWSERLYGRWRDLNVIVDVNRDTNANGVGEDSDGPAAAASVSILLIHDSNGDGVFDSRDNQWTGSGTTLSDGTVTFTLSKAATGKYMAQVVDIVYAGLTYNKRLDNENPDRYQTGIGEFSALTATS